MEQLEMYKILSYFLIYSFLGWGVEVAYQAISKGLVINRGFLNGPVCPIYGFGVVSILVLLYTVSDGHPEQVNAFGVFVIGVILATVIELFGGWALDKLFHARWWDYRDRKFNLNGYICPEFSVYWGIGIVILIRIIHPFIYDFIFLRPVLMISWLILIVMYLIYFVDFCTSVLIMIGLNKRFAELDELQRRMRVVSDRMSTKIGEDTLEKKEKVEEARVEVALAKAELHDEIEEHRLKYHARKREIYDRIIKQKYFGTGRMFFDNPTFEHRDYIQYIDELRREKNSK